MLAATAFQTEEKEKGIIIQFPSNKKNGKNGTENNAEETSHQSTKMECLYNEKEIMAVYNVLLEEFENSTTKASKRKNIRNLTMFVCAISIGLRGGDFCSLKWKNIFGAEWNFLHSSDFVPQKTSHRKNPKHITLHWNSDFEHSIINYLEWKRENDEVLPDINDYIFTSQKGGKITEKAWYKIIEEARKKAGIRQKIGTHGLRKTMAHEYISKAENKNEALMQVSSMFGHADLRTTEIYACIEQEKIKENKERLAFIFS